MTTVTSMAPSSSSTTSTTTNEPTASPTSNTPVSNSASGGTTPATKMTSDTTTIATDTTIVTITPIQEGGSPVTDVVTTGKTTMVTTENAIITITTIQSPSPATDNAATARTAPINHHAGHFYNHCLPPDYREGPFINPLRADLTGGDPYGHDEQRNSTHPLAHWGLSPSVCDQIVTSLRERIEETSTSLPSNQETR
ncbi:hypothetical protein F4860DRAFT_528552 [Xylaria cubensis]|nr:hypothetical protein F4860DRAFT_528552 [Xylaria cubensis]